MRVENQKDQVKKIYLSHNHPHARRRVLTLVSESLCGLLSTLKRILTNQ